MQKQCNINVEWRPFSLAMKNKEMDSTDTNNPYVVAHQAGHRIHRLIEAAVAGGADRSELYKAFGAAHFVEGKPYNDEVIAAVVEDLGLSAQLMSELDNTDHDTALAASLSEATDVAGNDIGVPLIVFVAEDGSKTGFFGPVITALPSEQEGLDLWDGLSKLASNKSFYELKRSRNVGPDVGSTLPAL